MQAVIDGLRGRGAGLQKHLAQLLQDPCAPNVAAYRLSGPLDRIVCGLHLDNGYRLAFTILEAVSPAEWPSIVVLYVGTRDLDGRRTDDIWEILHELFRLRNPPQAHHKLPCCENGQPRIRPELLDAFIAALQRVQRGR